MKGIKQILHWGEMLIIQLIKDIGPKHAKASDSWKTFDIIITISLVSITYENMNKLIILDKNVCIVV